MSNVPQQQFIDGGWVPSAGRETIDVIDPTTEELVDVVPAGHPEDVDRAVAAARAALPAWSSTSVEERLAVLRRLVDAVRAERDTFARLITQEVGTPIRTARLIQAGLGVVDLESAIRAAEELAWTQEVGTSRIVREPIGVVGAITPWNYPLHQITAKIGPALASGCTVVLKPSEVAPGCAYHLVRLAVDAGLPAGVLNLVCGTGRNVGEHLVSHPEVDMITFTGSNAVGRRVMELASPDVKRCTMELGGKSPSIIVDGADIAEAVSHTVRACLLNAGQSCSAQTRLLTPRALLGEVEDLVVEAASSYPVGDPSDESTKLGPVVSAVQRDRVLGFVRSGIDEGARVILGGESRPASVGDLGYFVAPTVFSDVTSEMVIAQEEIFGPVLSIMPYDTLDEAVQLANDTRYGLAAAVWAETNDEAEQVAMRVQAGQIEINGGAFNPDAPFGGYKQSGLGREAGKFGLEEFLETKSLQY